MKNKSLKYAQVEGLLFIFVQMSCHSRKTQIRQQENIIYLKEKPLFIFYYKFCARFCYTRFICVYLAWMDPDMKAASARVLCFTSEARKTKQINFTLP